MDLRRSGGLLERAWIRCHALVMASAGGQFAAILGRFTASAVHQRSRHAEPLYRSVLGSALVRLPSRAKSLSQASRILGGKPADIEDPKLPAPAAHRSACPGQPAGPAAWRSPRAARRRSAHRKQQHHRPQGTYRAQPAHCQSRPSVSNTTRRASRVRPEHSPPATSRSHRRRDLTSYRMGNAVNESSLHRCRHWWLGGDIWCEDRRGRRGPMLEGQMHFRDVQPLCHRVGLHDSIALPCT
jgi:hypothetical protein